MNDSKSEILHFKKRIEDKIEHAFLGKYIQKPIIDEDKLFILLKAIPLKNSMTHEERDAHIITTMLVQVALDTHELVPAENTPNESKDRLLTKQLHVLAGDYYSGLYYYLLAQIDDFKFIYQLAVAIKEINENKMKLYYQEYQNYQEYVDLKIYIETLLIASVTDDVDNKEINELLKEWFYMKELFIEKHEPYQQKALLLDWLKDYQTHSFLTNEEKLDHLLNDQLIKLEKKLNRLPQKYADFKLYFSNKINQHHYFITSTAKEG